MDLQQSPLYKKYTQLLKWEVLTLDGVNIFIRKFSLLGGFAKIQRPKRLPRLNVLMQILKQYNVRTVAVEPSNHQDSKDLDRWCRDLAKHFRLNHSPYLPTKTIIIDLKPQEDVIFQQFSEAKRRAVRRALKNNLIVKESANIEDLIHIKNLSAGLFGFITTTGLRELWQTFSPKNAAILLAYPNLQLNTYNLQLLGGVLLLFWAKTAYYWIAGATRQGKKLFVPTLMVWEALKLSKKRGCTRFDFVGVWDERIPKKNNEWKGFTKFKEGFGGKVVYYPLIKY